MGHHRATWARWSVGFLSRFTRVFNPLLLLACIGLNIYSSITFSILHMIYEGTWKVLVEGTFRLLQQRAASKAEFNTLGKRIDTWVVTAVAPLPFVKTSFT